MTDFAWVIEDAESDVSGPLYFCGAALSATTEKPWSGDHLHAVRFSRKEDAEQTAAWALSRKPVRVAEHGWG